MKINEGEYAEAIYAKTHVWYEKDWKHDEPHSHAYFQLNYVEQGYQYFHKFNLFFHIPCFLLTIQLFYRITKHRPWHRFMICVKKI